MVSLDTGLPKQGSHASDRKCGGVGVKNSSNKTSVGWWKGFKEEKDH